MREHESHETLEYHAKDGTHASMRIFLANDADVPVVVCLPAMGVRGNYYNNFAQILSRAGFNVVTSDLRGIGSSSIRASRRCDFGYEEIISVDLPALIEAVQKRFPSSERLLLGHSLGGQLSALYLSAHPEAAKAIILIAACNVYYGGWPIPQRWRVLGIVVLFRMLGTLLGYVPAAKFRFAGNEARTMVVDWSNNCFTGRYVVANSSHDYEASLRRMVKPVLAISFERDKLAPRRSVENFLCKLAASSVVHRHFAADHSGLENSGHFDWAKRARVLVGTIRNWADESLPPNVPRLTS
jgi:predicted alpha/beta hydrolase